MENLPVEPQLDDIPRMHINAMSMASLSETRRWTLFFAVLGIIGIVLMVLLAIVMMAVLPRMNEGMGMPMPLPMGVFGFVYLVIAAIYLLPVIYLLQFSRKIKTALTTRDSEILGQALRSLMLHFRTVGIIMIVFIFLYILIVVGMMVLGAGLMGLSNMV